MQRKIFTFADANGQPTKVTQVATAVRIKARIDVSDPVAFNLARVTRVFAEPKSPVVVPVLFRKILSESQKLYEK